MKSKRAIQMDAYRKTRKGHLTEIYGSQRRHSKNRGHKMPTYTKKELNLWIESQPNYEKVYQDWEFSGFEKMKSPSCDRLNESIGYSLDNIQLVSWGENKANAIKYSKTIKVDLNKMRCISVIKSTGNYRLNLASGGDIKRINWVCNSLEEAISIRNEFVNRIEIGMKGYELYNVMQMFKPTKSNRIRNRCKITGKILPNVKHPQA